MNDLFEIYTTEDVIAEAEADISCYTQQRPTEVLMEWAELLSSQVLPCDSVFG